MNEKKSTKRWKKEELMFTIKIEIDTIQELLYVVYNYV